MEPVPTHDNLDDLRVRGIRALVPSACLIEDVAGDSTVYESVALSRRDISHAVRGEDGRLLVVIGPVSVHDPLATLEYACKLATIQQTLRDDLIIVMRTFLDEPAGGAGYWSGAMYDPDLDGSFQINRGLKQARQLLLDVNRLGLPAGCLYCDTISPQFVADLVSWSCISSYSAQSRLHRELASGLSTPVGFVSIGEGCSAAELAIDAVRVAGAPHAFLSVSKQGVAGIVETTGNIDCHPVLPPGDETVAHACALLNAAGRAARVMVECPTSDAAIQVARDTRVFGLLLPSFLKGGAQVCVQRSYEMGFTTACDGPPQLPH